MQDKIVKFLAYNKRILVTCVNSTNLVEDARKMHDMSPVAITAFGRVITMAALMASEMKNEDDSLTIQIRGNGPLGTIVVVTDSSLKLKGYVTNPVVDIPLNEDNQLDVSSAVGQGFLNVVKDINLAKPYVGISPLVSSEIAEDFAEYFAKSEQKNTAIQLGVLLDENGVKSAGGYIISAMPDAKAEDISKIEQAIFKAGAISKLLSKSLSLLDIAKKITGDENVEIIQDNLTPKYQCDCSKDKMFKALRLLERDEIKKIVEEDGKAELVCHFCNKKYNFKKEELEELL